jgi:hypothetical protein
MARATAAEMLKLFGGTYPPGYDATNFVTFAAQADAILDTEALPATLSTTGTNEIALANRIAVNLVHRSIWLGAGGILSGFPEPVYFTDDMKRQLEQLLASTDVEWSTLDMIDEDA